MIGAIVYRLRAEGSARLPKFHGRLMHGLMFHLLQSYSDELASFIHDELDYKPFTVSLLQENIGQTYRLEKRGTGRQKEEAFYIKEGQSYFWRVTSLHDTLLQLLVALPQGAVLQVGDAPMRLEEVIVDGRYHTGVVDENELVAGALSVSSLQRVAFRFSSPVAFRNYDRDYPLPLPDLVFGSLADKWSQMEMPLEIDRKAVREAALGISPLEWQGFSRRVYFGHDRGTLAFTGIFAYDMRELSEDMQRIALMLAQFAEFSGTGRLTAQGFGQTKIDWR
ncbi:CRISPR system precrRNA processing endoribonuclease RAMP protein Cas6 [Mitsuokella sp. WILCCON 0060]|uniref:CRISPR system precrRNA processing endoribonuclease RAMP protein Cas6 n=1 Tax=Mitsuokella sp. WILCCON 0060 TaxID=3345341 RepID=UPI003F1AEFB4